MKQMYMAACVDVCLWVQMLRNKVIKTGYLHSSFSQSSQEAETQLIHIVQCSDSILHGVLGTKRIRVGRESFLEEVALS